ncbi:uncharacterized protein METZ01_LOCUS270453, partial [marine metagenome]
VPPGLKQRDGQRLHFATAVDGQFPEDLQVLLDDGHQVTKPRAAHVGHAAWPGLFRLRADPRMAALRAEGRPGTQVVPAYAAW